MGDGGCNGAKEAKVQILVGCKRAIVEKNKVQ